MNKNKLSKIIFWTGYFIMAGILINVNLNYPVTIVGSLGIMVPLTIIGIKDFGKEEVLK